MTTRGDRVKVFVELGVTLNLGDFESAKISLSAEAYADDSELSRAEVFEGLYTELQEELKDKAPRLQELVKPTEPVVKRKRRKPVYDDRASD